MKRFIPTSGRSRFLTALLAVTVIAAGGSIAWASIPDPNGVIHGCYQKNVGNLRVIDSSTGTCRPSEVALNWNQTGPKGATGPAGPRGPTGPTGPADRVALGAGNGIITAVTFSSVQTVSITAPAAGYVQVYGEMSILPFGNAGEATVRLRDTGTGDTSNVQVVDFPATGFTHLSVSWVFSVSAGAHTYSLDLNASQTVSTGSPTVTALYVPFGANG